MFWAPILACKFIPSYKSDDEVRITELDYCTFLDKTFFERYLAENYIHARKVPSYFTTLTLSQFCK